MRQEILGIDTLGDNRQREDDSISNGVWGENKCKKEPLLFPNASVEEDQDTLYVMVPTEKNAMGESLRHQEDSGRAKRGEGAIEDYLKTT